MKKFFPNSKLEFIDCCPTLIRLSFSPSTVEHNKKFLEDRELNTRPYTIASAMEIENEIPSAYEEALMASCFNLKIEQDCMGCFLAYFGEYPYDKYDKYGIPNIRVLDINNISRDIRKLETPVNGKRYGITIKISISILVGRCEEYFERQNIYIESFDPIAKVL